VSSQARKIKRLQTEAIAFTQAGDSQRALEKFTQLESLEPRQADWPRRAAECHRLLGDRERYVEALARAAKAYVELGWVVKAIAICRMMLSVDPQHPAALAWMSQLHGPLGVQAAAPALSLPATKKTGTATAEPQAPTAPVALSAARRLVAKKGLVAVARMVAHKATRNPPKSQSVVVDEAARTRGGSRPPGAGRQVVDAAEPMESPEPAVGTVVADNAVVSAPPLAVEVDLRQLAPGSCALPEGNGPSRIFRLGIDGVEPTAGEQALTQARGILPAIPLFSELDPNSLESLVRQSRLMRLRGGEIVFKQDDPPDSLYVVVNGSVAMFDEAATEVELYRVGENEFFGEGSLISNDLQATTVRAIEDCDLLAFDRESMRVCIANNPSVVPVLLRFLRGRMLEHLVRTSPLFAHLDTAERRALSRKFEFIEVAEDALLIQQGTRSPGLFVLLCGAVDVVRRDGDREQWLATLERGGVFGEISLLGRSLAEADVRSSTAGFALMLPAAAFPDVIMIHPPLLEVLSAISEERKQANARRLPSERRASVPRSPADTPG
jgi:CRP-like cAMP-binding protein